MFACPNCECPLQPDDLRDGKCPVCLTPLSLPLPVAVSHLTEDMPLPPPPPPEMLLWPKLPDRRYDSRTLLLLLAGLLVPVVIMAAIVLWSRGGPGSGAIGALPTAISTPAIVVAQTFVVTKNVPVNPSFGNGQTPAATQTAGATPTGTITITPTPTIAAPIPVLSVTPASVSLVICLGSSATITIGNTGGSALNWDAAGGYALSQAQGTLQAGAQTSVTVSGISSSGTVTVTATDTTGQPLPSSPQSVTIACGL